MMSGLPIIGSMEKFVGESGREISLEEKEKEEEEDRPPTPTLNSNSSNGQTAVEKNEREEEMMRSGGRTEEPTRTNRPTSNQDEEEEEVVEKKQPGSGPEAGDWNEEKDKDRITSGNENSPWRGTVPERRRVRGGGESDDDDDLAGVGAISKNSPSISSPPPHITSDGDEQAFIDRPPSNLLPASTSTFLGGGEREPRATVQTSQRRQIIAALSANLGSLALGATLAWTATALPDMREREKEWKISAYEESWIGSSMTLGAIFGCPVAGYCMKFGRRLSTILLIFPFLVGWLSIFLAQNLVMIYIGRALTGLGCGVLSLVVPVYIVETADPDIRGALTSAFDTFLTVGILYIFFLGSYTTWRVQALLCGVIPVVFSLSMVFMPESPRYLVENNRDAEAVKAIAWLRNTQDSQQVHGELVQVKRSVHETKGKEGTWRDFLTLPVLKPTSICFALMFFQQLSGIDPVTFYTVDIFSSAGAHIDEHLCVNIIGAAQIVATIVAALLVDRSGRRIFLLLSGAFMVLSLGALGLFFYLKRMNDEKVPHHLGWLPLSSLLTYVIAFSVGYGPLPWLLLGELIPTHVIGIGACLVTMSRWILGFACTMMFQNLIQMLGHEGTYWFFGVISLVGTIYVYFLVPETKNKTLHEIFLYFNPPRNEEDDDHPPLLPT